MVPEIFQLDNVLAASDDLRRKPWKGSRNIYAGHCYIVSEAMHFLCGGSDAGWKPMFVRVNGYPHWYIQHQDGLIFDYTAQQFSNPVPYDKGRGKGFLTKKLSRRTRILLGRLRASQANAVRNERGNLWIPASLEV